MLHYIFVVNDLVAIENYNTCYIQQSTYLLKLFGQSNPKPNQDLFRHFHNNELKGKTSEINLLFFALIIKKFYNYVITPSMTHHVLLAIL